ncbi:hypothetical protein C7M42_00027 [Pediococcus acidilactici]|nr:hypothetical protein C7M42_00027 [Pediococcus acidilactici]
MILVAIVVSIISLVMSVYKLGYDSGREYQHKHEND